MKRSYIFMFTGDYDEKITNEIAVEIKKLAKEKFKLELNVFRKYEHVNADTIMEKHDFE